MSIECIKDKVLCGMGRCPACEIARLNTLNGQLSKDLSEAKRVVMAYEWGLAQTERHVLAQDDGDLRVARFVRDVRTKKDADPALLDALDGDKR